MKIRHFSVFFLVFLILLGVGIYPKLTHAGSLTFLRTLRVGVSGEDVRQLQKILNADVLTRVQETGVGSPGQETTYFGPLTARAVVRFQEKYRSQILTPNGLLSGTGIVGPATLSVLRSFPVTPTSSPVLGFAAATNPSSSNPTSSFGAGTTTQSIHAVTTYNPNEQNLDKFLSIVETAAQKKGMSASDIATIKKQIVIDIATTTNLREAFLNTLKQQVSSVPTPVQSFISRAIQSLHTTFFPQKVQAASGLPFGGALLFSFFCTCSANWLITVEPLPPTFPVLLSYIPGSQAFLSYNIPFTTWLLGEYQPGAGICSVYAGVGCFTLPTEGLISPIVGSSPI